MSSRFPERISEKEGSLEAFLVGLNESQRKAVAHGEGPALVLAGPGSGKTTITVKRILYLIRFKHIAPEKILVVTFTKEAALAMQQRFQSLTEEVCPVNFGTFHSVFYHILLQSHYLSDAKILTPSQKQEIMKEVLSHISDKEYGNPMEQADHFLAAVGYYKNTRDRNKTLRLLPSEWKHIFPQIFQSYQAMCRSRKGIDFDDMVYECLALLSRDEELLGHWQERFPWLLVDEFQDINPIQYEVMKLLGKKQRNIFVVGDEDQSIYGFRGSDPACVRLFAEEFKPEQILLNANYRSTEQIVDLAGKVIAENQNRFLKDKNTYAAGVLASLPESVRFKSFVTKEEQLNYLLSLLRIHAEQNQTETFGVLFRTNNGMQRLAMLLAKEGIPFAMKERVTNLYDHFIVKDIMAYLKFAAGDRSRAVFLRIMNKPFRGIAREWVGERERIDLAGPGLDDPRLQKLNRQLEQISKMNLTAAVRYICKAVGYEDYLRRKKEAADHLEEWLEILEFCKEDTRGYLRVADWECAQKESAKALKNSGTSGASAAPIRLMTVHAAKGLEFDRVCIPDCNEKNYPYGNMPDKETVEEERRIFYVAMTRAKKDLELLCTTGTRERPRLMSRFLNPIIRQLSHQTHSCQDIRQKHP